MTDKQLTGGTGIRHRVSDLAAQTGFHSGCRKSVQDANSGSGLSGFSARNHNIFRNQSSVWMFLVKIGRAHV